MTLNCQHMLLFQHSTLFSLHSLAQCEEDLHKHVGAILFHLTITLNLALRALVSFNIGVKTFKLHLIYNNVLIPLEYVFYSITKSCSILCNPMNGSQASLSFVISQGLLTLMSIESVMSFNHLVLCCPLFLLHSIFPSIRVFSKESALHIRWQKYWSFSFSISPSNEQSGLISFRTDLFDLLVICTYV